jgi:hypothetical protein
MPSLNFKSRFAGAIQAGQKLQTIRRHRKVPIEPLDRLYLFTGMRTKKCRLLATAMCISVDPIRVYNGGIWTRLKGSCLTRWLGRGAEQEAFARADGFRNAAEFHRFFGPDFAGDLIRWKPWA